jgi:hypothetical protein
MSATAPAGAGLNRARDNRLSALRNPLLCPPDAII